MPLSSRVKALVDSALAEDRVKRDITTALSIFPDRKVTAVIVANEKGVLCGREIVQTVFKQVDKKIRVKFFKKEGRLFKKNQTIASIKGNAKAILSGERTALNFLSHLSGIATATRKLVDAVKGTGVRIRDTRKTTPNLRYLEKYAVRAGGGYNHRSSLATGILIKDNHLKAGRFMVKGRVDKHKVRKLISRLRRKTRFKIEIEVENLAQFKEIAKCKPQIVLLDNFTRSKIRTAAAWRNRCFPQIKLEASGGITLGNVRNIARAGVDFIAAGAITHSAPAINFSLDIK